MKTLKQDLAECTPQQLEQIFHLWGMSGLANTRSTNRQDILLQRMKDHLAARFVWEYLAPEERDILYRILHHSARGGTKRDTVLQKTQLPEERFAAALSSLKQQLLLTEQTTTVRVQPAVARTSKGKVVALTEELTLLYPYVEAADALYTAGKEFFSPNSDRSQMTLDRILSTFYYGNLNTVAAHYSLPGSGYYYGNSLREMIEAELLDRHTAFAVLQQLDTSMRDLFKWLCEQGGKVSMQAVRQHTGYDDTKLLKALHTFDEYALAFDTFSEHERVLFVPSNVFASLKKAATETEILDVAPEFVPLAAPPAAISAADTPVIYDMAVIVGAVYQQNIEPTQAGNVPKRIANKIRPFLHGQTRYRYLDGDDEYLEMLFHIAQEIGILRIAQASFEGLKPHYEPAPALEQWAFMDRVGQTKRLIECWIRSFHWLDIRGVNFRQWEPFYWNPITARASLIEHLQDCVPGQWYSVSALLQKIWDKDPFELRPAHYSARSANRQKTPTLRAKWNSCEGEVYIGILSSTLHELGIVTLGYQQAAQTHTETFVNPDTFMLTDLGAAVLADQANTAAPTSTELLSNGNRSLVLQPNFELLLLLPDMPTLYSILPFAQVNQIEIVSRLTMTKASILRGIEAGYDIEQILRILAERSQKEIPQNVAYTLRDWVKLYKDVKISQVLLLEVSSEAIADEISSSSKFKDFNIRKIAPRILMVGNDINVQTLRNALNKEGVIVRINSEIFTRQNRYSYSTYR